MNINTIDLNYNEVPDYSKELTELEENIVVEDLPVKDAESYVKSYLWQQDKVSLTEVPWKSIYKVNINWKYIWDVNKNFNDWAPSIKRYDIHRLMKLYFETNEKNKIDVNEAFIKSCLNELSLEWNSFLVYNDKTINTESKKLKISVDQYKKTLDSFLPVIATWWLVKNYVFLINNNETNIPIFIYLINKNQQITKFDFKKQLFQWILTYIKKINAKNKIAEQNWGKILYDDKIRKIAEKYEWIYN